VRLSTERWILLSFLLTPTAATAAPMPAAKPPNLVVILADDLGYGDVGCYNPRSRIPTPHLDKLASQSRRFTDAHSPAAVCTPSRYGLLTGRYCWRTRLKRGVFLGFDPPLIEPERLTLPGLLQRAGYETASVGKWHVGMTFTRKDGRVIVPGQGGLRDGGLIDFTVPLQGGPTTLGFASFFGCSACPTTDWLYAFIEGNRVVGSPSERFHGLEGGPLQVNRPGVRVPGFEFENVDLVLAKRSVQFLTEHARRNRDQPFFLYHAASAPHLPALPAERFKGQGKVGPLGDFIHEFDWVVGTIVDAIDRLGLGDNTLILVASDNGPETVAHDLKVRQGHDSSGGLRGMKRDNWEGGHRVPFLARWTGRIRPGTTSDEVVCLTGVMATAAALVSENVPEDAAEDSYNILPALLDERPATPIREATVHHSGSGMFAVRQGRWKFLDHRGSGSANYDDGSIPVDPPVLDADAPGQLYDLEADPGERKNLYRAHPEIVSRLQDLLESFKSRGRSTPVRR